jgi:hypothetical protein
MASIAYRIILPLIAVIFAPTVLLAQNKNANAEVQTTGVAKRAIVYKDPNCGCCDEWIAHLKKNGFSVSAISQSGDRSEFGIPRRYGSCHTAKIDKYAIEGHVPASDILRLLEESPDAIGLSVPNMPIGAPGMDGEAYGGLSEPYQTLLIANDGSASVFSEYK